MNHIEIALPAQPNVYEGYANDEVAAYQAHRRIFEAKNPPPVKPDIRSGDTWLMLVFLNILYLAAVIVSAPHTIPLFLQSVPEYDLFGVLDIRYIVAVAAFVMIEIALLVLTFVRIKQRARTRESWENGLTQVGKWLSGALILVFTVALFANIYSTLDLSSEKEPAAPQTTALADLKLTSQSSVVIEDGEGFISKYGRLTIFLLIGGAAPMLALLVGDVSAILWVTRQATHREQMTDYEQKYDIWNQSCITAYRPAKIRTLSGTQPQPVKLIERPDKQETIDLMPTKLQVDGKVKYQCPSCNKVITRQAWQHHGCRFVN